jgi:hypothetical protein
MDPHRQRNDGPRASTDVNCGPCTSKGHVNQWQLRETIVKEVGVTTPSPLYLSCPKCGSACLTFKYRLELGDVEAKCKQCGHVHAVTRKEFKEKSA